jgi:hypothetical protein
MENNTNMTSDLNFTYNYTDEDSIDRISERIRSMEMKIDGMEIKLDEIIKVLNIS